MHSFFKETSTVHRVLALRSWSQLAVTFNTYHEMFGRPIIKDIRQKLGREVQEGMKVSVVLCPLTCWLFTGT